MTRLGSTVSGFAGKEPFFAVAQHLQARQIFCCHEAVQKLLQAEVIE